MAPKTAAGLLMYKFTEGKLKVFLVHSGGPYWKEKDIWGIPKGERDNPNEDLFDTARREFWEETGIEAPIKKENYIELGEIKQRDGKVVHAWAFEGDWIGLLMCRSFVEIEWPYKSGKKIKFPEIDKASFFTIEKAKEKIVPSQFELVERLIERIK